MNGTEFRIRAKEVVDYIADYNDNILKRTVTPSIRPGFLKDLLPSEAPQYPEKFEDIMKDYEEKIMIGITHWNHPRFYAYFPSGHSYPSFLGDMLSGMTGSIGFNWVSNPSCTELEIIVLDWFAKALGLPEKFLSTGKGGGVIQGSASDILFVVMAAARYQALKALAEQDGLSETEMAVLLPKLVAYCSRESHSCVEKAAKLCLVRLRILDVNDEGCVTKETLESAMSKDEAEGLTPFFYSAVMGSTSQASFDKLTELGPVCQKRKHFWLHVDGAYAGTMFVCPEMRYLMDGMDYVKSFNVNPNKWCLTHFDLSVLWVDNILQLTAGLIVDPVYLKHEFEESGMIDRRHMHVPLSRRFRALKLWFVLRLYGITGLQKYIRNHMSCAKYFESLVRKDDRFEITNIVRAGLVCFRLKGPNSLNQDLVGAINQGKLIHLIPSAINNNTKFIIRLSVNYEKANLVDIDYAWSVIRTNANNILTNLPARTISGPTIEQHREYSFTRNVSQKEFDSRLVSLSDFTTPVIMVNDDDDDDDANP